MFDIERQLLLSTDSWEGYSGGLDFLRGGGENDRLAGNVAVAVPEISTSIFFNISPKGVYTSKQYVRTISLGTTGCV
jgi:hypothetical protein